MANLSNPVDDALLDMDRAIRDALNIFMEDNHLSERERRVYTVLNNAHATFAQNRKIQRAFQYYTNNPTNPSRYGMELIQDAGLDVINLEDRRNERKIIQFPTDVEHG